MIGADDLLYLPDEVGRWSLDVFRPDDLGLISYTTSVEGGVFRAKVNRQDDGRFQVASTRVSNDENRDEMYVDDLGEALDLMSVIMHEVAPDGETATMRPDDIDAYAGDAL